MIYFGYDPGGKSGVAILDLDSTKPTYQTGIVRSVDEAIQWLAGKVDGRSPTALGIDALLYWETGRCGWRCADLSLREAYPLVKNSVLSANSAAGAMVIQGLACAIRLRKRWPDLLLTETHPKVVYYALTRSCYSWSSVMVRWLQERIGLRDASGIKTEDEWDALISAWIAMKGHTGAWKTDLRGLSKDALEPAGGVQYWWPEEVKASIHRVPPLWSRGNGPQGGTTLGPVLTVEAISGPTLVGC